MWLCDPCNGHLLDDRSDAIGRHQFDSSGLFPVIWYHGHWRRLHGLYVTALRSSDL